MKVIPLAWVRIRFSMLKSFNYWLTGYGWAEVFFTSDRQAIRFVFSYLSDPLSELIDALLDIVNNQHHESTIDLFDEPGHYQIKLKIVAEGMTRIEIRLFAESEGIGEDSASGSSNLIFEDLDTLSNFCAVIYSGILDLKNRHSEAEYLEKWINCPFPEDKFAMLTRALSKIK